MTVKIDHFTKLDAWKEGRKMTLMVYQATEHFPSKEQFGLTSQLRRAGISFVSNIAEGFGRQSKGEKVQFYSMALGSLNEIQSQLIIARDLGYISEEEFEKLFKQTVKVHKITNGLIRKIKGRKK